MSRILPGLMLALLAGAGGCGEDGVQTVTIRLSSPQAIDPANVASVVIAAVHEPSKTCVSGPGSNSCVELRSVKDAEQTSGYVKQMSITSETGSTAVIEDLPQGQTCFVAEAISSLSTVVGLGCAEVELTLDRHVIEIELQ
jgi:hypothetical protein